LGKSLPIIITFITQFLINSVKILPDFSNRVNIIGPIYPKNKN